MIKLIISVAAGFIITVCGLFIARAVDASLNWLNTSLPPNGGVYFAGASCVLFASTGVHLIFFRKRPDF